MMEWRVVNVKISWWIEKIPVDMPELRMSIRNGSNYRFFWGQQKVDEDGNFMKLLQITNPILEHS
mgnify:CR=1 FL=1